MYAWVHARVIGCPETDSQACCLQTNLTILKRPSTPPSKPCMAKLKRPLLSQMAQRVGLDPLHFTQLLENGFTHFISVYFCCTAAVRSDIINLCVICCTQWGWCLVGIVRWNENGDDELFKLNYYVCRKFKKSSWKIRRRLFIIWKGGMHTPNTCSCSDVHVFVICWLPIMVLQIVNSMCQSISQL